MNDNDRSAGLIADDLGLRLVYSAGLGGGSGLNLALVAAGVRRIAVIDHDDVEAPNLPRTAYTLGDIGQPKAEALARHMRERAEGLRVTPVAARVQDALAEGSPLEDELPDLLIAGTDSFEAQAFCNSYAVRHGVPALFVGVHERAAGGMLVLVLPGETPCYRCVAKRRYEAAAVDLRRVDMPGARGLGADLGFIDHVALKIALAVLSRGTDTDAGRLFAAMGRRTQIIVRCHPEYRFGDFDIFDLVLDDLPRTPKDFKAELQQHAFLCCDTLWLQPDFDPECPDCHGGRHG